ncbi:MAG: Mu transposase C-terminal domain-containing protein, partial [Shewanella algae]
AGCSRKAAINEFLRLQVAQELPASIQNAAALGNAKGRGTCYSTLRNWVLDYCRCKTPAERLAILAPKKRKARKPEEIKWLPSFLVFYRQYSGLPITEAYEAFESDWRARYADEPVMLAACPTYKTVCYQLNKLSIIDKSRGRTSGSDMRALLPFVNRDWEVLPVNYCWIGDGHGMKMKCAHPIHGRPFSPELTLVIDGRTRFVVGWSLALSENVVAVADALRFAISHHGKPWLYYSDNGAGETNKTLDADVTGILPRLGIDHPTGIKGNAQGRGIIERLNRSLAQRISRRFDTYFGTGADRGNTREVLRKVESASEAFRKGTTLSASQQRWLNRLPTWEMLIETIKDEIERYNTRHEHSELPKQENGRHFTPARYREHVLNTENTTLEYLTQLELREMFCPQVKRRVSRGCVQFLNNSYFARELANWHTRDVLIGYDIHDAQTVSVRSLDGEFICDALWDGNKVEAFPVTAAYHNHQQRIKGMTKRAEKRIEAAEDELKPALPYNLNGELLAHPFKVINGRQAEPVIEEDDYDPAVTAALNRSLDVLEERNRRKVNE